MMSRCNKWNSRYIVTYSFPSDSLSPREMKNPRHTTLHLKKISSEVKHKKVVVKKK